MVTIIFEASLGCAQVHVGQCQLTIVKNSGDLFVTLNRHIVCPVENKYIGVDKFNGLLNRQYGELSSFPYIREIQLVLAYLSKKDCDLLRTFIYQ